MQKTYKVIAILTALSIISAMLLSSCGIITINSKDPQNTKTPTVTETDPPTTESDPPLPSESAPPPTDIPDPEKWEIHDAEAIELLERQTKISFEGKTLYIIDAVGTFSDPLIENNIYSEAKYERNRMLEEMYGYEITVSSTERESLFDEFKNTVAGGNTFCDLLSVPLADTGRYITAGLVLNMRSLPFFEASGDYSIPSFDISRIAGNDAYFSIGYATLDPNDLGCIYFNREFANEASLELYDEVDYGEFTIERYHEILKATGGMTVASTDIDLELTAIQLSPVKFFESGYQKTLSFSVDKFNEAAASAAKYLSAFTENKAALDKDITEIEAFESGKAVFRYGTLGDIEKMSERKLLFGILPMPKADISANYVTPVSLNTAALMITSNTEKSEMCSISVSAINAASYKWLIDSAGLLYASYYIPDIRSLDMIKIINENPVLDFAVSARGITDLYDSTLIEGIRRKSANIEDTLDDLFTSSKLNSLKNALTKYYN